MRRVFEVEPFAVGVFPFDVTPAGDDVEGLVGDLAGDGLGGGKEYFFNSWIPDKSIRG